MPGAHGRFLIQQKGSTKPPANEIIPQTSHLSPPLKWVGSQQYVKKQLWSRNSLDICNRRAQNVCQFEESEMVDNDEATAHAPDASSSSGLASASKTSKGGFANISKEKGKRKAH